MIRELLAFVQATDVNVVKDYGVIGAIAVIAAKSTFELVKSARNGRSVPNAGEMSKEFWQLEMRESQESALSKVVAPRLDQHQKVLEEIRDLLRDGR